MAAAPTGCFKCGRPGHWSRDCPSSSSTSAPNSNPNPNFTNSKPKPPFPASKFSHPPASGESTAPAGANSAPKKRAPRTLPKLTPDLLLSDDGLGYVLRHFPRPFKYHGRGHEVTDLGNLIGLYAEWHSHLIPYYSFDQFIKKVEQVGATKRVRRCIGELRERVARGGDPTKLHESPQEQPTEDLETDGTTAGDPIADLADSPMEETHDAPDVQENLLNEIYPNATDQEAPNSINNPGETQPVQIMSGIELNIEQTTLTKQPNQEGNSNSNSLKSSKIQLTDEQRARMEANHLKALERAATRARPSQPSGIQT